MNDKKQIDLRKNFYVDTVAISGDYIRIVTDNANTVINLKDKAFADIKEININGAKFCKIPEDSVVLTREEYEELSGLKPISIPDFNETIQCRVKQLEIENNGLRETFNRMFDKLQQTRKETAREFAEKLKSMLFDLGNIVNEEDIDELLKEFNNENK